MNSGRVLMSLDNLYDSSSAQLQNRAHNGLVLGDAVLLKITLICIYNSALFLLSVFIVLCIHIAKKNIWRCHTHGISLVMALSTLYDMGILKRPKCLHYICLRVDLISTVTCKKPYEWVGKTDME
uniref:Uncharacterized protein n=1 Tax=Lactuca sativa TaxID=4236 RepID=A0A9R1XP05_LACSA|nr:hypothetical protein LSAT_V11C200076910 [Lactuca sativa]